MPLKNSNIGGPIRHVAIFAICAIHIAESPNIVNSIYQHRKYPMALKHTQVKQGLPSSASKYYKFDIDWIGNFLVIVSTAEVLSYLK